MPELIGAALDAAASQRIDMLSLNPLQQLGSFWERLIIPAGLVAIACTTDLRPIDDPASPEVTANGQFILIRRAVYFAVGGHAAGRGAIREDKAVAALAWYSVALRRAGHITWKGRTYSLQRKASPGRP